VSALLGICIPTYNRAGHLSFLIDCLTREIGDRDDILVLVSNNASSDDTARLLEDAAASRPWLSYRTQPENVGPVGNMDWLVENAPVAEYLWLLGDDDYVVDGGLVAIAELLRDERPAWLFLPHRWVDEARRVTGGSPAPGAVVRYATGRDIYLAYHHWLTFLSASILRTEAFTEAVRTVRTENLYAPVLWFFRAGLGGPCVVAPSHLVHGGQAISWADRAHIIQTLHFTSLYDEGLHAGLSAAEFGATLDGLYRDGWGLDLWRRVPIERLAETVARFPQSQGLREYLWTIARESGRRDVLPTLSRAAEAVGADTRARELVEEGERIFAAGDAADAAERFGAAARLDPTLATAWSDLAVAHHELGRADALAGLDSALFVDPDDLDALLNRASILLSLGDAGGAAVEAQRVMELDPGNAAAAQLLGAVRGR
jgi:hypothetical protein